ncbi:MAG: hypothetical protein LBE81_04995 [Azonexus sp.]|jgi:hypothetical protein|uniref:hypothetical protein n=1 Tax=Azonexus sp. TaxID=1872668 RepID=UPI002838AF76|nr:hypothetical protein [Azonexus sp.]MDR0775977.1 hypothetical protein [Azonexus sp.]
MEKINSLLVRAGVVVSGVFVAASANAASVLDADAKAAITEGFTQMKDTALDVVSTSWPFLLGILAVMFAPKIVKRLAKSV